MNELFILYTILIVVCLILLFFSYKYTIENKILKLKEWSLIFIGMLLLTIFSITFNTGKSVNDKLDIVIESPSELISTFNKDTTISDEKLYKYLLRTRVNNPEVVLCQAKIESNDYTSPLFRRASNLIGMKIPSQRMTTGGEESGEYQKYPNGWKECITDYIIYSLQMNLDKLTQEEYITFLSTGKYAKDSNYADKIRKKLKSIDFNKLKK